MSAAVGTRSERLVTKMPEEKKKKAPAKKKPVKKKNDKVSNQPRKVGRPANYTPEYCDLLIEYFLNRPQVVEFKKNYYKDGTLKSEEPVTVPPSYPTFQGFAMSINTTAKTLWDWKEKYPEFGEAYARAKDIQESILLVNGIQGLYNPGFCQFIAKNTFGYKDKVETENKTTMEVSGSVENFLKGDGGINM